MNYIQVNFTINTCCLIFLIFLIFIYLSKKNANNLDNKIYKQLLFWNLLVLIFNTAYPISLIFYGESFLSSLLCRIYGCCYFIYFLFLLLYILYYSLNHNKEIMDYLVSKYNKLLICLFVFIIIFCIPMFFLSLDFIIKPDELIGSGAISSYMSIIFFIEAFMMFLAIILNLKYLDKSKLIPFAVLGILSITSIVIVMFFPSLVSLVFDCTIITYLMYHTIENPDMKMVNELTLAKDSAEKAAQVKSEFLSSMSHELRTPLNAIIGLTDSISDSDNMDEIKNDIKDIRNSSNNLLNLVDQILLSNNIDNNNVEINNSKYNFKELLDGIISNTNKLLINKNIDLKVRLSDDLPEYLFGDKEKVKTIINNLLSNSIKYTNEGFIELDISCLSFKDKCTIKINVSDTGIGIKDEDVNKLYDKFYRSDEFKDSDIVGTGLGLSITKSLVELLDGKITANSNYGEGTTFLVTINQKVISDDVL